MDILEIISKGLVPFTQLVKVRRITWFWHFQASDFAKDCLLTLVKSRLALGSPGCLVVCDHAENG